MLFYYRYFTAHVKEILRDIDKEAKERQKFSFHLLMMKQKLL